MTTTDKSSPKFVPPKMIDDLEPHVRDQLKSAMKYFDEMKKRY